MKIIYLTTTIILKTAVNISSLLNPSEIEWNTKKKTLIIN